MDILTASLIWVVGIFIGLGVARVLWRRGEVVSAQIHQELVRAEAVARGRIGSLDVEKTELTQALATGRAEVLELSRRLSAIQALQPQIEASRQTLQAERDRLQKVADSQQVSISELTTRSATLDSERKLLIQQLQTQKDHLDEMRKNTRAEFQNLAQEILNAKSKDFNEQTEKSLDAILKPLREKIVGFEKSVEEKFSTEGKERHALKSEIERLIGLNDRMSKEARALTDALKGDSKVAGDWGELVLEKILEASGLREGHEYSQQKSHENEDGERMRPDIVINLPEGKHVVIDSKVSLKAYELHRRSEEEAERGSALESHLASLRKHMDDLGDKHYSRLKGVRSPEFVFMFIPIEPAYIVAMQADPELSTRAWKQGVALVTATTLLTSLKTVASIWRLESQNRNAQEIASEGAKLYDKFVGFLEDFEKIGKTFETGQVQFSSAMGKLRSGSGNVFRKMELLRELGAAPAKRIKQELIESSVE
jgi:DNA recombination protein RmuC